MQVFVPPVDGEGPPEHRFALVPKSDYDIVDDWFSPGQAPRAHSAPRASELVPGSEAFDRAGGSRDARTIVIQQPPPTSSSPDFSAALGWLLFVAVALYKWVG